MLLTASGSGLPPWTILYLAPVHLILTSLQDNGRGLNGGETDLTVIHSGIIGFRQSSVLMHVNAQK